MTTVTLHLGDCLDIMRTLPAGSVDAVVTDPPYFRVKDEQWDRQWKNEGEFLAWLELAVMEFQRILKPNGSLYLFASPAMSAKVEVMIGKYFLVINNIRWVKENGWHKKADEAILRGYLSNWESIIFAEKFFSDDTAGQVYYTAVDGLHKKVYAPIGGYIKSERERAGYTRNDVEVALGYVSSTDPTRGTALCYRWEEGSSLPTKEAYEKMRDFLNGGRKDYEYLRKDYEDLRRPFMLGEKDTRYTPHTDTWNFPTVAPSSDKHPAQKPISMIEYIIRVSTKKGATILDAFAGSGTTGEAAYRTDRNAILIEKDAEYFKMAERRIRDAQAQPNLFEGQP